MCFRPYVSLAPPFICAFHLLPFDVFLSLLPPKNISYTKRNTLKMRFNTVLSSGAAVATASAFLINPNVPVNVNSAQLQGLTGHPYPTTYKLDCSTCPLALNSMRNDKLEWTNGVKSDLLLNFEVKDNSVVLNGLPMMDANANNLLVPMKVKQVVKEGELEASGVKWQPFEGELGLSYSTHQTNPKLFKTEEGITTLYEIDFQVLAIAGQNVNTDDVLIKLIKDPSGKVRYPFW